MFDFSRKKISIIALHRLYRAPLDLLLLSAFITVRIIEGPIRKIFRLLEISMGTRIN